MILELWQLKVKRSLDIKLIHVAGTWRIANAIDGLTWGEVVMDKIWSPENLQVLLHLSPLQQTSALKEWIGS
jgi:hypothetical protein